MRQRKRMNILKMQPIVYVLLALISFNSVAQNKTDVSKKTISTIPDIEKVYLHTDRSY